jgi:hypothetical protein
MDGETRVCPLDLLYLLPLATNDERPYDKTTPQTTERQRPRLDRFLDLVDLVLALVIALRLLYAADAAHAGQRLQLAPKSCCTIE